MTDAIAAVQDLETARHLLDIISGAPLNTSEESRAAAVTELTGLLLRTGLHEAALEMLVSGALFNMRSLRDSRFVLRFVQQVKSKANASIEDIDAAAFFPKRAGKALENLTDIPENLLLLFKHAAPKVLAELTLEELTVLLLSTTTPDWLVRMILAERRALDIFGQAVCPSYGWFSLPADKISDEQKEAELDKVMKQARKVLEWLNKCPAEYLPVSVDMCSLDVQECLVGRLGKELDKMPADKLLTLISLNMLPAWLRKAAENRFQELTKSAAAEHTK
jgi:hypothetical protein